MTKRAVRHLGTYYFASSKTYKRCGHRHATVRAAMVCKRAFGPDGRIFCAHFGREPATEITGPTREEVEARLQAIQGCDCQRMGKSGVPGRSGHCLVCGKRVSPKGAVAK